MAACIITIELWPHVQLPFYAHLRVLVNPAWPSKEGLDLWQRVERSPWARDDDTLCPGRSDHGDIGRVRRCVDAALFLVGINSGEGHGQTRHKAHEHDSIPTGYKSTGNHPLMR